MKRFKLSISFGILCLGLLLWSTSINAQAIIADHTASANFDLVPGTVVEQITADYNIYYGHTSHGSQIMTGLDMVETENALYDQPYFREVSDDLGHNGDTSWDPITRTYLDAHPECNMVMWSWCGGCSDNTEEGINIYLNTLSQLEIDYPDVIFIYMTGHLDATGVGGNLYARNNQIRNYCATNGKILFDFADIESYDPDGNYYPDEGDYCSWCYDWCAAHSCPGCGSCAHSHCFNCYQKGKAWWWMMARISGWYPGDDICGDVTGDSVVDLLDILFLIDYKYKGGPAPDPIELADTNDDGSVNLLDILALISYKYKDGPEPTCPEI